MTTTGVPVPQVSGLATTQADFNRYQSSAFASRSPQFFALEIAGEVGELANLEKKAWRDPTRPLDFEHLSDEAADVFISLMNYCNSREIKLEEAVKKKLVRIEDRRVNGLMGAVRG